MIEVFAVILVITVLIMLLLPAVQSARENARRVSCSNNLMQVGLAVQLYHQAFEQLPTQLSGTDGSVVKNQDNDRRLSLFVALLPFVGDRPLWEQIRQPLSRTPTDPYDMMMAWDEEMMYGEDEDMTEEELAKRPPWGAGGPEPFVGKYSPWSGEVTPYRCPSDPGVGAPALGRINYAACLGDAVMGSDTGPMKEVNGTFVLDAELSADCDAAMRGMFVPRRVMRFSDVTDGLAQTLMLGEISTDLGDVAITTSPAAGPGISLRDQPQWARVNDLIDEEKPQYWVNTGSKLQINARWGRGMRWADGMPLYTGFNTILSPHRETVMRDDRDDVWGILPPSSRHQGGVNVCFADGAVRFISDSIEAGDPDAPTVYRGSASPAGSQSPYGLWGALGTRASAEIKWYAD